MPTYCDNHFISNQEMIPSLMRVTLAFLCIFSPHIYAWQLSNGKQILKNISLKTVVKNVAVVAVAQSLFLSGTPSAHAAETTSDKSASYGLKKGRLLPCKSESNCISSSSIKSYEKYGRPWSFAGEPEAQFEKLVRTIQSDPYLRLVDNDPAARYVRAEAKSAVPPSGVDDVEFLINGVDRIITYRSNSRELVRAGTQVVGDAGSNRNRLEGIKRKLGVSEMEMDTETEAYLKETSSLGFLQQMKMMSEPSEINFVDNSVPETRAPITITTPAAAVVSEKQS